MSRSIRLVLVGLLSALLTLGMAEMTTVSATAAPAAAAAVSGRESASCTYARQQDSAAAADVSRELAKYNKTTKKVKKAKKVYKKSRTVKHKKAVKKAKKKNKKARAALVAAQNKRGPSSSAVVVFCGTNPAGTPPGTPLPASTPGTSPLQPLCDAVPQLKPLCDATAAIGDTSPLAPVCAQIPQLALLCTIKPGDLANPTRLTDVINQVNAVLAQGGVNLALIPFVARILTAVLTGNAASLAAELGTTPAVLVATLRALGIPVPAGV